MLAMNYSPALWATDQNTTTYARLGKQPKAPDAEPSTIGNDRIGLTTGLSPLVKPTLEITAMTSKAHPPVEGANGDKISSAAKNNLFRPKHRRGPLQLVVVIGIIFPCLNFSAEPLHSLPLR